MQLQKCRKLVKIAEKCLNEAADYYYGIEACNEVLDGGYKIDPMLRHDSLCLRAALLLQVRLQILSSFLAQILVFT